jgi:hypothetical protein
MGTEISIKGASVNPTSQYLPVNYNGSFADSSFGILAPPGGYYGWAGIRTQVGTLLTLPTGVDQNNVAPYLESYGLSIMSTPFTGKKTAIGDYNGGTNTVLTIDNSYGPFGRIYATVAGAPSLELNVYEGIHTIGNAYVYAPTSQAFAGGGMAIYEAGGEAVIGCGISSGANGVFRASGVQGFVTIGNTPSTSIGIDFYNQAIRLGSLILDSMPPSNTTTPVKWAAVVDQNGVSYRMPLYQ